MKAWSVFVVFSSVVVLVLFFYTTCNLVVFLSSHTVLSYEKEKFHLFINSKNGYYWMPIFGNSLLLILFMGQHSLQSLLFYKNFVFKKGLDVLERAIYIGSTCLTLQLLMRYWQPVHQGTLWEVTTSESYISWWLFTIVHSIAWIVIYTGSIIMDMPELIGIKQVYYSLQGWPDPLCKKSEGLCRLYQHMRHPSFTSFTIILFFHPVMQVDRFLLATVFTVYMLLCFRVDETDHTYHKKQFKRKELSLQVSFTS